MATAKAVPEQLLKTTGSQTLELCHNIPSPLQNSTPIKPELDAPRSLPKSTDIADQKPNHHKKGSIDALPNCVPSKTVRCSETNNLRSHAKNVQLLVQQPNAPELLHCLEGNGDHEKKIVEHCSENKTSASAKVSDGTISFAKSSESVKTSDRADFVESGKSSMCKASTSSDVSDESSCSSLSSGINKPHKANDSRWEAIQVVRTRDGVLGLSHFRLLKRLGCGDIGSVYLSELTGTKCYFAMKVMDKGSLASRKKLLRAQTEREILQSLDHPFLPTLYTHFETDKFSCLVMEFCPGGDLHTLRQRQPGKHFAEQAVKYGLYLITFFFIIFCV